MPQLPHNARQVMTQQNSGCFQEDCTRTCRQWEVQVDQRPAQGLRIAGLPEGCQLCLHPCGHLLDLSSLQSPPGSLGFEFRVLRFVMSATLWKRSFAPAQTQMRPIA